MSTLLISEDIIPIAQFKIHASEWFKKLGSQKHTLIITNNGRAAGVLLSPAEYDRLTYTSRFISAIQEGLEDVRNHRTRTSEDILKELDCVP
jgi:prevent-host-death family protein